MTANPVKVADELYFKSMKWMCEPSPTGAHHWLITGKSQECKYCKKVEEVNDCKVDFKLHYK